MKVEVGQIWKDNDKRMGGSRYLQVVDIRGEHAYCGLVDMGTHAVRLRLHRIRLDRFKPTASGYVFTGISGLPPESESSK